MATYTESTQKYGIVVSEGGTAKLIGEVETLFVREDVREGENPLLLVWAFLISSALACVSRWICKGKMRLYEDSTHAAKTRDWLDEIHSFVLFSRTDLLGKHF